MPTRQTRGFALIITITLLSFLVLLLVSLASLTRVETQVASNNQSLSQARQNALFALNIAIGQLQKHVGPDQRVTAPATTVYPSKDATKGTGELYDNATYGYRGKSTTSNVRSYLTKVETYLTPAERTSWDTALQTYWNANRNPRYVGVFDSSLRVDRATNPAGSATALPRQQYEFNPATTFGEFKRDQIPVWLVSGVESYVIDQEAGTVRDAAGTDKLAEYTSAYSPVSSLPDPATDSTYIWLVNTKSATLSADSSDGLDGRVKVKKQEIKGPSVISTTTETIGHYAYWIGDESMKANFAVHDPYHSATQGSVDYRNRLQSPQRLGWERMSGFDSSSIDTSSADFLKVLTPAQIPLLDSTLADTSGTRGPTTRNFHSLTSHSKNLFTDTALGGLKKDLTVYLETGAGLNGGDPIANPVRYSANDARFKAWSGANTGFPLSTAGIPSWSQIRNWHANASTGGAAINATRDVAPIVTYINLQNGFSYDPATQRISMHWIPAVVLWNPYDAPLNTASYDLDLGHSPTFDTFYIASPGVAASEVTLTDVTNPVGTPDTPNTEGTFRNNSIPTSGSSDFFYPLETVATAWNNTSGNSADIKFSDRSATAVIGGTGVRLGYSWNPAADKLTTNDAVVQPHPTATRVAIDQTMKFRITDNFAAGESKIYTLGDANSGDDVVNWSPGDRLPMKNIFVPDTPASASFPVLKIKANAPSADAGSSNGLNRTLKWSAGLLADSYMSPYVRLALAGDATPISETLATGYVQFSRYSDTTTRGTETEPVSSWKHDIPSTDRLLDSFTPTDTYTSGSIWRAFRTWLAPLTSEGGSNNKQVVYYYGAFSRFNLARSMDPHPQIEALRDHFHSKNSDLLTTYHSVLSTPNADNGTTGRWDENQYNGGQGYSLVQFQNIPGSDYAAQPLLPLRSAKRVQSSIVSLGQFQQVNLSPYQWQPTFPIGNSDASPYADREAIAGIHSRTVGRQKDSPAQSSIPNTGVTTNPKGDPVPGNSMLDLSYLLNESLWDSYFLSAIPHTGSFATYDPATGSTGTSSAPTSATLLPNSRIKITDTNGLAAADVRDFDTASAHLYNVGALNVNSTSVEAWKALLTAFRDLKLGDNPANTVPIAHTLDPVGGSIAFTDSAQNPSDIGATSTGKDYTKILNGFRYLNDTMIQTLAERIVDEVRLRGPFMSLGDFVNRRLVAPSGSHDSGSKWYEARTVGVNGSTDTANGYIDPAYDSFIGLQGLNGALQRAINVSGMNGGINYPNPPSSTLDDRAYSVTLRSAGGISHTPSTFTVTPGTINTSAANRKRHVLDPSVRSHLDSEHWAGAPAGEIGQTFQGTAGFVTQGDLLSMIGSALTPRGDTFLVRTYGDAVNPATGQLSGRAWLEAVVQRTADPVTPAGTSGSDKYRPADAFGRKFKVVSFRWLSESEL